MNEAQVVQPLSPHGRAVTVKTNKIVALLNRDYNLGLPKTNGVRIPAKSADTVEAKCSVLIQRLGYSNIDALDRVVTEIRDDIQSNCINTDRNDRVTDLHKRL